MNPQYSHDDVFLTKIHQDPELVNHYVLNITENIDVILSCFRENVEVLLRVLSK